MNIPCVWLGEVHRCMNIPWALRSLSLLLRLLTLQFIFLICMKFSLANLFKLRIYARKTDWQHRQRQAVAMSSLINEIISCSNDFLMRMRKSKQVWEREREKQQPQCGSAPQFKFVNFYLKRMEKRIKNSPGVQVDKFCSLVHVLISISASVSQFFCLADKFRNFRINLKFFDFYLSWKVGFLFEKFPLWA